MDFLEYEGGPNYEGAGPHFHKLHVDSFYVLEGELQFWVGEETHRAGPGTFVAVPPGIVHAFTNPGPGSVRFLNVHAPTCGFTDIRAVNSGEDIDPPSVSTCGTRSRRARRRCAARPRRGRGPLRVAPRALRQVRGRRARGARVPLRARVRPHRPARPRRPDRLVLRPRGRDRVHARRRARARGPGSLVGAPPGRATASRSPAPTAHASSTSTRLVPVSSGE